MKCLYLVLSEQDCCPDADNADCSSCIYAQARHWAACCRHQVEERIWLRVRIFLHLIPEIFCHLIGFFFVVENVLLHLYLLFLVWNAALADVFATTVWKKKKLGIRFSQDENLSTIMASAFAIAKRESSSVANLIVIAMLLYNTLFDAICDMVWIIMMFFNQWWWSGLVLLLNFYAYLRQILTNQKIDPRIFSRTSFSATCLLKARLGCWSSEVVTTCLEKFSQSVMQMVKMSNIVLTGTEACAVASFVWHVRSR